MKLLYGTSNPSKLSHMRDVLEGLNIDIIGLDDLGLKIDIEEKGSSPLENAIIKAKTYYEKTKIPCFSADSGLYIEGLKSEEQPGVYVRRVGGNYLDDEEFINHYQSIALKCGGQAIAKFKNAICLILDEENIITYDGDDIADHFILTSKVHPKRKEGFPMDSIAIDIGTNHYLVEESKNLENEKNIRDGIRHFF